MPSTSAKKDTFSRPGRRWRRWIGIWPLQPLLLGRMRGLAGRVRRRTAEFDRLSDEQLMLHGRQVRARIQSGASLASCKLEVLALTMEATRRQTGLQLYDEQIMGAAAMCDGWIAQMATGEGKTVTAVPAAALHAMSGRGVHILTVNDYLADRDAKEMGPIYRAIGLSVGLVVEEHGPQQRKDAYHADITYGTHKLVGHDYLRDELSRQASTRAVQQRDMIKILGTGTPAQYSSFIMQRRPYAVFVDEADSVMIDEARTALIIAGADDPVKTNTLLHEADNIAVALQRGQHYTVEVERHQLKLTVEGRARIRHQLSRKNIRTNQNIDWPARVTQALRARWLYHRDINYVLVGDEVVIVDEFTGRLAHGRRWQEGLHQAIQIKEKLPVRSGGDSLAQISYQKFFLRYPFLAGMTGTAAPARMELAAVYQLGVLEVPTHRPVVRKRLATMIYHTRKEKFAAVVEQVLQRHRHGQPVLVGTRSVDVSEQISELLKARQLEHHVLNARHHEAEAEIVAHAGQIGTITIATNMAGRGTDIKLGAEVAGLGGLHVISTEMNDSKRIDDQLAGRAGRQGDPGSVQSFLSLQDPLMLRFGRKAIKRSRRRRRWGQALRSSRSRSDFHRTQRQVERTHYRARQALNKYEQQRQEMIEHLTGKADAG